MDEQGRRLWRGTAPTDPKLSPSSSDADMALISRSALRLVR